MNEATKNVSDFQINEKLWNVGRNYVHIFANSLALLSFRTFKF